MSYLGRIKDKEFSHTTYQRIKQKEPFEMIHMDTVLNSNESIYGNKYFFFFFFFFYNNG